MKLQNENEFTKGMFLSSKALTKQEGLSHSTLAKTGIYPKNVGALVAVNFTLDNYSAPRKIEKMKILGDFLELPAKQHCQSSTFLKSAVLFSW